MFHPNFTGFFTQFFTQFFTSDYVLRFSLVGLVVRSDGQEAGRPGGGGQEFGRRGPDDQAVTARRPDSQEAGRPGGDGQSGLDGQEQCPAVYRSSQISAQSQTRFGATTQHNASLLHVFEEAFYEAHWT